MYVVDMCLLRSVSVSEKNQLSKSELYPKKLPAQLLPASAILQGIARRSVRGDRHQLLSPEAAGSVLPPCGPPRT
jgi:hypothetical protein